MSTQVTGQTPMPSTDGGINPTPTGGGSLAKNILSLIGLGNQDYAKAHPIQNMIVDGVMGFLPGMGVGAIGGNPLLGGAAGAIGGAMGNSPYLGIMLQNLKKKRDQEKQLYDLTYQNKVAQQQAIANNLKNQNVGTTLQAPTVPTVTPVQNQI